MKWQWQSISLNLHLIAQVIWLVWRHPTSFMLCSWTPLAHRLSHLSLIASMWNSTLSVACSWAKFHYSDASPQECVTTFHWSMIKGLMLTGKGHLGGQLVQFGDAAYLLAKLMAKWLSLQFKCCRVLMPEALFPHLRGYNLFMYICGLQLTLISVSKCQNKADTGQEN